MRKLAIKIFMILGSFTAIHADTTQSYETGLLDFLSPLGKTNKYDLLLTVGIDQVLENSPFKLTEEGFNTYFGWDQTQIDAFRQSAVEWFSERFGIDFSQGYYDQQTGTISTNVATLFPVTFTAEYPVLSSNSLTIIPFTPLTPSRVLIVKYIVSFNDSLFVYGGTYANGEIIEGKSTDLLAFGCYKILKNHSGSKSDLVFLRSYYPTQAEPIDSTPLPPRRVERLQLFSEKYGSGFAFTSLATSVSPDEEGKYPTFSRESWSFPGSFEIPDWNEFKSAPIAL